MLRIGATIAIAAMAASSVAAAPFEFIRLGDKDGFGYEALPAADLAALKAADGGAADRNGNGRLEQTEFLPDLNEDGLVQPLHDDDFDNRSSESPTCAGCSVGAGNAGVEFTDISLSTSYDSSSADGKVFDANTNTFGAGGAFPAPPSSSLPNQPGFVFDFFVASGDITAGTPIFFNLIFGDFGVSPAEVEISGPNLAGTQTIALTTQRTDEDGLIQAATTELAFSDVFANVAGGFQGDLNVNFVAPNEPYTAFDFVELSLVEIPLQLVPLPATAALFGIGLAGLAFIARRRRAL